MTPSLTPAEGDDTVIAHGMIHGRFQPFHNGHFGYLKHALDQAETIIVGITNPDPLSTTEVSTDSHRHLPDANPFSFYQRMKMIRRSIVLDEQTRSRIADVEIVPFPITRPELWEYYIPMEGVAQFVVPLEPWDEEKLKLFCTRGFRVVRFESTKRAGSTQARLVSGTEVRDDIRAGNSVWRGKVPAGTLEVIEAWLRTQK